MDKITDEEKEAIELLENDKENIINSFYDIYNISTAKQYEKSFRILLKLAKKLQKEMRTKRIEAILTKAINEVYYYKETEKKEVQRHIKEKGTKK